MEYVAGQLKLCGECKQDWLTVACDPHSTLCFLSRGSFHPMTAVELYPCLRVTIAPSSQSWAGVKPTCPSSQWPPLRSGLVGRDTESHLQVVLQNKQSLSGVLLLCGEERGLGMGRGGPREASFPVSPSVSHMPARSIKAVTRSRAV